MNELVFLEFGEEFLGMTVIIEEKESLGCWLWVISKLSLKCEQKDQPLGPWGGLGGGNVSLLVSVTCQLCGLEQVTSVFCSVV